METLRQLELKDSTVESLSPIGNFENLAFLVAERINCIVPTVEWSGNENLSSLRYLRISTQDTPINTLNFPRALNEILVIDLERIENVRLPSEVQGWNGYGC